MQPPIPIGTLLQNRYQILKILGQGGFGRTYLAEDKGRFNEWCALKEFIPQQTGTYALEKSKELFQREASTLYQIRHPQVPQFRATFEQEGRLFLVQDYVEGKTYRALLAERQYQGRAFSEAEIHKLLEQLLPVLAQIHAQGIIHRDISPDNIMWRQSDSLPVLIDFGVVKEVVTRFRSPEETVPQATTVGKAGYAPKEQMQMGLAYPSSDLYALAVTLLVLLTGREPQELFDPNQMSWQIPVGNHPQLRPVLSRMLSYQPSDRFAHANEVLAALQTPQSPAIPPTQPFPVQAASEVPPTQPFSPQPPTPSYSPYPNPSEMATMVRGRAIATAEF
uniref:Protein kinase domain-containing protein n=1 Tax=Desertifilum tharense IPPAS B-1220 TaxID=1781255 RepID=A0ACD5GTE8_9CYAN